MKSLQGKGALWLFATACSAVVAFGAGQAATQTDAEKPLISDTRGEQIMNQSCTSCHEVRNIETQALDKEGWGKMVSAMIEKGSTIKAEDVPGFVEYLVRKHGPLPEGAGKKVMLRICTQCHDLERVRVHLVDREGWEVTLQSMMNEGAQIPDEEFPVILNYLIRNFKPKVE